MRGASYVAARVSAKDIDQVFHFSLYIVRPAVWQGSLDVHTPIEANLPAEAAAKGVNVHRLRLNRVENIKPDLNEIRQDRTCAL